MDIGCTGMKLSQNTFNQRKLLGFALAADKPMREKKLLLPLYLRQEWSRVEA